MKAARLATVVRIRDLKERLARADVARERHDLEAHLDHERDAWDHLHRTPRPTGLTAPALIAHRARLAAGLAAAENAAAAVHDARRRLGTATALWQEEAQRLDGVERLAERHRDAPRVDAERVAHTELDDLVVARWNPTADRRPVSALEPLRGLTDHPSGSTS